MVDDQTYYEELAAQDGRSTDLGRGNEGSPGSQRVDWTFGDQNIKEFKQQTWVTPSPHAGRFSEWAADIEGDSSVYCSEQDVEAGTHNCIDASVLERHIKTMDTQLRKLVALLPEQGQHGLDANLERTMVAESWPSKVKSSIKYLFFIHRLRSKKLSDSFTLEVAVDEEFQQRVQDIFGKNITLNISNYFPTVDTIHRCYPAGTC